MKKNIFNDDEMKENDDLDKSDFEIFIKKKFYKTKSDTGFVKERTFSNPPSPNFNINMSKFEAMKISSPSPAKKKLFDVYSDVEDISDIYDVDEAEECENTDLSSSLSLYSIKHVVEQVEKQNTSSIFVKNIVFHEEDITPGPIEKFSIFDSNKIKLPVIKNPKNEYCNTISSETLVEVLKGNYKEIKDYLIIDCRFPYEFEGGHIMNAINIYNHEDLESLFSGKLNNEKVNNFNSKKRQ
jgi:hypothetical protein